MTESSMYPLIDAKELQSMLYQSEVKIIDTSWYLPTEQRYPLAEFEVAHIPGAKFFDIDLVCDTQSPYPHMLPSGEVFANCMSQLGIKNSDLVVVYDGSGVFSAPRLWWMMRVFGHRKVKVLNGGMPAWREAGGDVVSLYQDKPVTENTAYTVNVQSQLVLNSADVLANIESSTFTLLDARTAERFAGTQPEPRPGVRSGHIPNSCSLPFKWLLDSQGKMLPADQLQRIFDEAGIDIDAPIATSCGSGITACVLALALYCLGKTEVPVYDGSWGEWGARAELPIASAGN